MSFAFVFPGQGSQSVGMLASLAPIDPVVRATFDEASAALGYDLWQLIQEGPLERLNPTEFTQPAMLAAGIATARLWARRGGGEPTAVSGHSLGEFTALVAAGALEFSTAIALVKFRGQAMQEAVPAGAGAMAAILGLEDADVEAACKEAAQGAVVEAVNFNAPGQVVIAGETAAVQRAIEAAKARGAKRAVALPVSVPSHSSLMRSAAERLGEKLADTEIRAPRIQYISAVDAATHSDPADIRALLVRQLASPVRWRHTVRALAATGIQQLIECGPGKVLTSLNKRVEQVSGVTFAALEDPAALDAALNVTKGSGNA
ncbi:MAG TPA: ACP S-malonyltransferase [Steroidobacteraceae bacterium]|nr:ACP S-malonyltransferase [Steroidobacteraceae bacterium]